MSYINFLLHGVDGQQASYRREAFQQDSFVYNNKAFNEEINDGSENDNVATINYGEAYTISTVSDRIRRECTDIWSGLQNSVKTNFKIGSAVVIVSAIGIGVLSPTLAPVVAAITVIALGVFGLVSLHRFNQAGHELSLWDIQHVFEACRHQEGLKAVLMTCINDIDLGFGQAIQGEERLSFRGSIEEDLKIFKNGLRSIREGQMAPCSSFLNIFSSCRNMFRLELSRQIVSRVLEPYFNDYPELRQVVNERRP